MDSEDIVAEKSCTNCGVRKPLTEFHRNRSKRDGHQSWCKSCKRELDRNRLYLAGAKPMGENRECASYLGVFVAESVLRNIFSNVEHMPYGHKGCDFICDRNFRIDAKSSVLRMQKGRSTGYWRFNTRGNEIADYFICLAFDSRECLNPMYCWLIPASDVREKECVYIAQSTIDKWKGYERDISDIITCCNDMKLHQ